MPRQAKDSTTINEELKEQSNKVFQQPGAITETVPLLTKGLVKNIPKEIIIRPVLRKDKKHVLMSNTDDILTGLLQEVVVSPKDFNVYNLPEFEIQYLLYRLRVCSYGSIYTFRYTCPYCGETFLVDLDLNELNITPVPDDFQMVFDIPKLPISGDVLTLRITTAGDEVAIDKQVKDMEEKLNNQDAKYDLRWMTRIVAINGNSKLADIEKSKYLDELTDYDSEFLMEYYNRRVTGYGIQEEITIDCTKCKRSIKTAMPSVYRFFRPTFERDLTK